MLKEQEQLLNPLSKAALEVFLHKIRNPLAGASALVQKLQQEQPSDTLEKILERIDVAAQMLSEGESFFGKTETEQELCTLSELLPDAPPIQIAMKKHALQALFDAFPGTLLIERKANTLLLHINHKGEATLTHKAPPAECCTPKALSIAAAQHLLRQSGGSLSWSETTISPSPYTLTLKVAP